MKQREGWLPRCGMQIDVRGGGRGAARFIDAGFLFVVPIEDIAR
jgi:hypothetical protein